MPTTRTAVLTIVFLLLLTISAGAQQNPDLASPNIVINLPSRTLEFYSGSQLIKVYPVAIGKPSTPTPLGNFYVMNKEVDPAWYPPKGGAPVPSGPNNPLGYRWMGFLPMYGVHGTNAPWAIGLAVSNGCVRMREADVEELFEVAPEGTPVRVTYDRVKVRINEEGKVSVGVYPDIYGYQSVTLSDVRQKLAAYGFGGLASDADLAQMIEDEPDKQIEIAQLATIRVNDKTIPDRLIIQKDIPYVPVWAVAKELGVNLVWDEAKQTIQGPNRTVPAMVKGDRIYVTAANLQALFGGQIAWRPEINTLEFSGLTVMVNGKALTSDVAVLDGVLAVPIEPVARALGQKVFWDPDKQTAMLGARMLPIGIIQQRPYMKITQINEVFHAYVYWNQAGRTIELTYPSPVKGDF